MSITCGFFDSTTNDPRYYNADQMSAIFDGILNDGVFRNVGSEFRVMPNTGLRVSVSSGRAWLKNTWTLNDGEITVGFSSADLSLPRIDAIVLETNHSRDIRNNTIKVVQGIPATSPRKPSMINTELVAQLPLAYVTIVARANSIVENNIEQAVGKLDCPYVTGLLSTVDSNELFSLWNRNYNTWFSNLRSRLDENLVTKLQNQIDQNTESVRILSEVLALYGLNTATLSDLFKILSISANLEEYSVIKDSSNNLIFDSNGSKIMGS